eukprot:XP_014774325.1 PREDICTED: proteasome assembly chaperone 1-like [Octopus bimaculoides]
MATFFGEVLPVFSRATGDDDDFDEDEEQEAELTWKTSVQWCEAAEPKLQDNKLPCSLLIISVGQVASGFCQAYLLKESTKPAGWLSTSLTTDDPTLDHNAEVHLCGKDSVFIQCTKEISPEQSFCWVHQVFDSLQMNSTEVFVLTSAPASDFQTEASLSQLTVPFLRTLRSSSTCCLQRPPCPYLEQPNLISSLSAQILTYCQIFRILAQLFVCYCESIHIDSTTIKAFSPLLKLDKFVSITQNETFASAAIKKFVDLHSPSNSLYL